jgi:hypothetical protein
MNSLSPRALAAMILLTLSGCSSARDDVSHESILDPEPTEETAEQNALKEFAKKGPGTTTTITCVTGSARIVARGTGSTVLCRGPNASTTTITIECEHGEAKSITRRDRLTVYCPEQTPSPVTARSGK